MEYSRTLSNGRKVNYWTYHENAKTKMVLIHGFTGSHEGFQYLIPLLPDICFIVPDLPGFGSSELPAKDDWIIDAIARLTNEFVKSLNITPKPHILGHSMGGLVVSSMLAQAPGLYHKKAVLVSPVPTPIGSNDSRRGGAILAALQYGLGYRIPKAGNALVKSKTISRAVTNLITTTSDRQLRSAIHEHHFKNLNYISSIEFYSKLHHDINRRGAIAYANALQDFEILLITGDADSVTPIGHMRKLAAAIKPKEFIVLPGVGHLIHYEKPNEIAMAIQNFIPDIRRITPTVSVK